LVVVLMHSPTPNYGLIRPEETDSMSDFETQINANWDTIAGVPAPNSGAVLPQAGSYNVGDRFYKTDTQSIYILVTKDANWGWYWRPVQDAISPWFVVPSTALIIAGWTLNPVAANPMAIALDNRGKCYWRGVIGPVAGNIARAASIAVFGCPPIGIRPRLRGAYMLGHETLAVNNTPTSLQSYQGARIFISEDSTANSTVRCFGGTADFNRIHLGPVQYATGNSVWYTP
jgi:hypothetical protein